MKFKESKAFEQNFGMINYYIRFKASLHYGDYRSKMVHF